MKINYTSVRLNIKNVNTVVTVSAEVFVFLNSIFACVRDFFLVNLLDIVINKSFEVTFFFYSDCAESTRGPNTMFRDEKT